MPKVLHVLSQRPSLTGSGVTLDALVRKAATTGWDQHVVVGVPADDPEPQVGGLPKASINPLRFDTRGLRYPVPGMSDVMPYPSTRFSAMDEEQVGDYIAAWRRHLTEVVARTQPDLIHSHHVWLVSSILREVAPSIPIVVHCHATGIRQLELCPHLAGRVREGCSEIDQFVVLHRAHQEELCAALEIPARRVVVVGAGYREDLFHARGRISADPPWVLFIGKYSASKGLPCLLDAVTELWKSGIAFELHVAGSGSGFEADELLARMEAMSGAVVVHGQLGQSDLACLMRRSEVAVLPSFYEGLPLVLVESFASGCRVVASALPGVVEQLAPALGDALELVDLPTMAGVDTPIQAELPAFTDRLQRAIAVALASSPLGDPASTRSKALAPFTWTAVFHRIEKIWLDQIGRDSR